MSHNAYLPRLPRARPFSSLDRARWHQRRHTLQETAGKRLRPLRHATAGPKEDQVPRLRGAVSSALDKNDKNDEGDVLAGLSILYNRFLVRPFSQIRPIFNNSPKCLAAIPTYIP